jgi:hypothetical protein
VLLPQEIDGYERSGNGQHSEHYEYELH